MKRQELTKKAKMYGCHSLPPSLGKLRKPENSYAHHRWTKFRAFACPPYLAAKFDRHIGHLYYACTPGYMGDPRNKTLLTDAMKERRFQKWCVVGKNNWEKQRLQIQTYWRARPELTKKLVNHVRNT